MGKLECFAIRGLDCWFNSNDHLPAHFHAGKPGEWEMRVFFLACTRTHLDFDVKWGHGPSRKYKNEILEEVLKHRARLLLEWEQKVCR